MASAVHEYKYSVQVKGRFDLLANEDYNTEDPEHLIRKMRSQKQESKTPDDIAPAPEVVEKPVEGNQREQPRDARGKGPRGRGGFSRSRVAPASGQRQFDRHSGSDKTGVKPVMKKGGHGTGNWGTIEDELEAQMAEPPLETPLEKETPAEPATEPEQVEEDEGPKTLTLKEYKEQKAKAKVELSTKGSRRPNDGKNVFSNMVEVHKSKPTETKVPDVLEEEKPHVDKSKPVFFEFARGEARGRRPRPSGPGEFRGRGGAPRFQPRRNEQHETTEEKSSASAPSFTARPPSRGSRGSERGRGFGRGRGGPRGSFNHERGGGRGGAAAGGDRPIFRGSRGFRGGPRGGFRGGRDHNEERRPESAQNAAPLMDSEADFPALK